MRLFEATGEGGPVTLLTDGGDIYVRTLDGRFFNLLKDPTQPLLVVGEEASFKVLASRARPRKKRPRKAEPATECDDAPPERPPVARLTGLVLAIGR